MQGTVAMTFSVGLHSSRSKGKVLREAVEGICKIKRDLAERRCCQVFLQNYLLHGETLCRSEW